MERKNREEREERQAQIQRMELSLDEMERELESKYCEMGKNLMEMADHEQQSIGRLVDEIVTARKRLSNAKYHWKCQGCTTANPQESKVCSRCGRARGRDEIQLLFALDENYLPPLRVMLTSLFLNNPRESFGLWLMHKNIPEKELVELEDFCDSYGICLYCVQVDAAYFEDTPVQRYYTQEMYYRLLAPRLLPEGLERVLYLDPDLLIINSIRPLWDMDMKGMTFAAASHTGLTEFANTINKVRLGTDHNYFNSGVLLIDLERARREVDLDEVFRYAQEHKKELLLPDQDIFNGLYGHRTLEISDYIWNYDARNYANYQLRSMGEADLDWVMANTAILHFCGSSKPWKKQYRQKFGILYKHYMSIASRPL